MNVDHELQELADDPELVISIELLGPGTWRAHLGDIAHGYSRTGKLASFNDAVAWLRLMARKYYPRSRYALREGRKLVSVAS